MAARLIRFGVEIDAENIPVLKLTLIVSQHPHRAGIELILWSFVLRGDANG
jgi:hypothetical protein